MDNPRYGVNINYQPKVVSGWQDVSINGVTHSTYKYDGDYYIASMLELSLSATGSSYTQSLSNLLDLAAAAPGGNYSLSIIKTW